MSNSNTQPEHTPLPINDYAARWQAPCHTDGLHVLSIGQCTIHASSNRYKYDGYALVLNLTGWHHGDRDLVSASPTAQRMIPSFYRALPASPVPKVPVVTIDWPDGGIPDFKRADWMRLIEDLAKIKGKVLVHCMGGHGRTGTALAALLFLSKAVKGDVVKWLRDFYCQKVVESESQIAYLKRLGIPVKAEPRYIVQSIPGWPRSNFVQEQYNLTKPGPKQEYVDQDKVLEALYKCILCQRKHTAANFYQTFLDMTGFCWACHQLSHKTHGDDLQSS